MIYEHTSYRSFLKEVLAEKAKRNPKFSLRAMAKHLGFAPSSLSEVMSGSSGFSLTSARKVASKLDLSTNETEYLCLLVQLETSQDPEVRESVFKRMKTFMPRRLTIHDLGIDQFRQISEWYHLAIMEMTDLDGFELTASGAARRLGISKIDAEVAIERLLRLGLLKKNEKGKLIRTEEHLLVQSNAVHNQALRKFYRQMMQKASEALETQSPKERIGRFETLPMTPELMKDADEIIERFFTEMVALSRRAVKKNQVYHLAMHFFNLTGGKE